MKETILAVAVLKHRIPGLLIKATAKLCRLGEQEPYFSLTGEMVDKYGETGGQIHDELLKQWPNLKPLADIHLSDDNGVPIHAVENGYYWAGGNREWCKGNEGDPPNPFYLASHLRISVEEAHRLIEQIASGLVRLGDMKAVKAEFAQYVEAQKPRWLEEAKAARALIEELAAKESVAA